MKKLVVTLLSVFACVACSSDDGIYWLIDWNPIEFYIFVQSAEGEDLLNPQSESAISLGGISLDYDGESYSVEMGYSLPNEVASATRTYMATFQGIRLEVNRDGEYYLCVGEWSGDDKRDYTKVILNWNDGTSDEFGFTNDYEYNAKYKNSSEHNWGYTFKRTSFFNGEVMNVDSDSPKLKFCIVK